MIQNEENLPSGEEKISVPQNKKANNHTWTCKSCQAKAKANAGKERYKSSSDKDKPVSKSADGKWVKTSLNTADMGIASDGSKT